MRLPKLDRQTWISIITSGLVMVILLVGFATRNQWLPKVKSLFASSPSVDQSDLDEKDNANAEANSLHLSPQAIKNIGLQTTQIKLETFERPIRIPAMVVERPGRSQVDIAAPFTSVVTRIYKIQAEAVKPGEPLFDLRLTHEDLVDAQRAFLLAAEELKVVKTEVARLEKIAVGVLEGRYLRERIYEQQKIEASLRAQRQGLLLHGLDGNQVDKIRSSGELLQQLTVTAPDFPAEIDHGKFEHVYHVQKLLVNPGQQVTSGTRLAVLADHCEVFIEGKAFEQDAEQLTRAARPGWEITAVLTSSANREEISGLRIFYLSDIIEEQSRAYHFYLKVSNEVVRDVRDEAGHRFVTWKLKPGQRVELRVPVERWKDRIVLPVDAVAVEGSESYVFEQNGDHFDRVPVHVEYRDKDWVVIENDGRLFGSTVVTNRAHQLQMALKDKVGGGSAHGHPHPH